MKLWILRPINERDDRGPWRTTYDCSYGFVVRATSETHARQLAANSGKTGDEHRETWLDATLTTCQPLEARGERGVVMVDFLRG